MKQKWVDAFMDTAERFAQLSSAVRLKVGSVIIKDNRIISIGYNGMPAGWDNTCEYRYVNPQTLVTEDVTKKEVLHAEENAILKLARDGESGSGATLFATHAPCVQCAKMIYGAGISKVYYRTAYRNTDGIDFLGKCNITVEQV
jgi:dCMP deaminase